ncbi:FHA domain-containing protein [Brevibacillus sp. SYP-B805]|uniref:FHA domain-containing protein n=1 Tax=Brevibacillus sp. SYP-B805 TaxID=1578199 RepID=UPI0013ECE192|nr:FHA domain-containing protein [Brevibacillus sp. SYP-B805]NGQ93631.1 FHA domain-containing protein [Brevibacillus sp. SYP-B805]
MKYEVYLVVEKGAPFQSDEVIALTGSEVVIGRNSHQHRPDIAFTSLHISRQHAVIRKDQHGYSIVDLASMHGTEVNGVPVRQTPVPLRDRARIILAKGEAVLQFHNIFERELEHTKEFVFPPDWTGQAGEGLTIHPERREVYLDGQPVRLSGKDMELLLLLYQRVNQAVSFDEIKAHIWPERLADTSGQIPDVGYNEITVLVYRLRKKLGRHGERIVTVPRYGYMLDL